MLMDVLMWIFGIFVLYLSVQYIVGPITVYLNQRLPERYKFELLDPDKFLSERGDVFKDLHNEILINGFRYAGSAEMRHSHSSMYFSIYYSEEKFLTCILIAAEVIHSPATMQMELTQMYDDGTLLSVSNYSVFGVYPKWEIKESYRFPGVNDFSSLVSIAEKVIRIKKPNQKPKPMIEGKEFETIERHLNEEMDRLVNLGWVSSKIINDEHKLTPKGAALMTWKMCWPIKVFIDKTSVSKSMKVLKSA